MPRQPASDAPGISSSKARGDQAQGTQTSITNGKTPAKSVSEARRLQNRISSKKYREKRRQKLEALQNLEQLLGPLVPNDQSSGSSGSQNEASHVTLGDVPMSRESVLSASPLVPVDVTHDWGYGDMLLPSSSTELSNTYSPNNFLLDITPQPSSSFVPQFDLQMPESSFATPPGTWTPSEFLNLEPTFDMSQSDSSDLSSETYDGLANIADRKTPRPPLSAAKFVAYFSQLTILEREKVGKISLETGIRLLDLLCGGMEACLGPRALTADGKTSISQEEKRLLDGSDFMNKGLLTYLRSGDQSSHHLTPRSTYLPDVHKNHIRINQQSFLAAAYANSKALGYDFNDHLDEESISPICCFETDLNTDDQLQTVTQKYSYIPKDLRPTLVQLRQRHHLYLDLLPFPVFRQRAIAAVFADPPLIDEDEFCVDLLDDGLLCYGSANGGTGTPWDMRSWEPQEWFLKKYWFLVGDTDGDMWSCNRWWRSMRGDDA